MNAPLNLKATHFELLGFEPRFALDAAQLDANYRALQARVHPDRHATASDTEKRLAMQWSLQANEAYQTLRDPLRRARYLCELNGVPVRAEDNTAMPAAFLMQQMQWREALDEAGSAAEIDALEAEVRAQRSALLARIAEAIDARGDYAAAVQDVRALMFVERFADELDEARG
jgi:molecular chaperone HscB